LGGSNWKEGVQEFDDTASVRAKNNYRKRREAMCWEVAVMLQELRGFYGHKAVES
jgi:hypothetical protein